MRRVFAENIIFLLLTEKTDTIIVQLSERLASLGIVVTQLGVPLITPARKAQHYGIEGFNGGLQLGPHYVERHIFWSIQFSCILNCTHREIFLKSYYIKPKSDSIYHFPIDLENGRYNLISV